MCSKSLFQGQLLSFSYMHEREGIDNKWGEAEKGLFSSFDPPVTREILNELEGQNNLHLLSIYLNNKEKQFLMSVSFHAPYSPVNQRHDT